jgi:spore coat polysaccharide biosynthesis predicted glycosyltransferase SpsG
VSGPEGVPAVGFRCDTGALTGVGHLIRCIALAEELLSRHVQVLFLGDLAGVPWAARQLYDRGLRVLAAPQAPEALAELAVELNLAAMVLDGYHLDPGCGAAIRARGLPVLALLDGEFGVDQRADLYLDQNLGAVRLRRVPPGAQLLAGLEYALLRDVVRDRRPPAPAAAPAAPAAQTRPPSVLAVFGGTDPYDAALTVVPLLLAGGNPVSVSVVAARPAVAQALRGLPTGPGQQVRAVPPVDDLPALVRQADVVVSASGSSVWELLCLGAPTAVVCVVANQLVGYQQVVARGLAAPLGQLEELNADPAARATATEVLTGLLTDPAARTALSRRGMSEVDGRGRVRVADALLALIARRTTG